MKPSGVIVRSADFEVQSVPTHGEAIRFVRAHHYAKGGSRVSVYRHGMYRSDPAMRPLVGELVGVAIWIPPTPDAAKSVVDEGWQGVLCLSRLAIAPEVGTNGASFLLGRSMRLIDRERWPRLLTYADPALGHTGAIYRATNWECMGASPGGAHGTWTDDSGRRWSYKRGGRTYSEREMESAGLTRIPDMGKIKFVHHA